MSELKIDELNPAIQEVLASVNKALPKPVRVGIADASDPILRPSDGRYGYDDDDNAFIQIDNAYNLEYTFSHELSHLFVDMGGFPMVHNELDLSADETSKFVADVAAGIDEAVHEAIISSWQRKHGILTDAVRSAVIDGVEADVTAGDDGKEAEELVREGLTILDGLIIAGIDNPKIADWQDKYPTAFAVAGQLLNTLLQNELNDARGIRRTILAMFASFNEMFDLEGASFGQLVVVPPVVSERQLRQPVGDMYRVELTPYKSAFGADAVIAFVGISDEQVALMLHEDQEMVEAGLIAKLIEMPLGEVINRYELPFTQR
ncbi:hypothetical protein [Lacticaseibacillus hulanensis]|uniref:hypothetical protein n=1 Tax=Lacticaseibacillus hulanensis TaxID=2493111 RepID=UPI000FDACEC9|nr:hypothetical protein [Lacticaseibacillus hulanensis]